MEEEGEVEKKKNSGMLNQRIQPYLVMCTRNINDGVMDEKTPAEVERVLMANHARPESEREVGSMVSWVTKDESHGVRHNSFRGRGDPQGERHRPPED